MISKLMDGMLMLISGKPGIEGRPGKLIAGNVQISPQRSISKYGMFIVGIYTPGSENPKSGIPGTIM